MEGMGQPGTHMLCVDYRSPTRRHKARLQNFEASVGDASIALKLKRPDAVLNPINVNPKPLNRKLCSEVVAGALQAFFLQRDQNAVAKPRSSNLLLAHTRASGFLGCRV